MGPEKEKKVFASRLMLLIAAILGVAALWHAYVLPPGAKAPDAATNVSEALRTTGDAWASERNRSSLAASDSAASRLVGVSSRVP